MGQFRGKGGRVYALGEPHHFHNLPLRDCGDGWDWQAPDDLRYWLDGEVTFECALPNMAGVVEIDHCSGRVSFDRNLGGRDVTATGVGRPTALILTGWWEMEVHLVVRDSATLGPGDATDTWARSLGATVLVDGNVREPIQNEVLVVLPTAGQRAFVGVGKPRQTPDGLAVNFENERITHGYR